MKPLPIPKSEQIAALLNGSFFNLLSDYVENPKYLNTRKFITITRQDLVEYLNVNPDKANAFFAKELENNTTHDVARIWREENEYVVAWMDHGEPRNRRAFHGLAEAIADLVIATYGIY